jgi:hypothetical protein
MAFFKLGASEVAHAAQPPENRATSRPTVVPALRRNAVAITWSSEKVQPPRVRMSQLGQRWVFICGTHDVTLDWQKGDARVTR